MICAHQAPECPLGQCWQQAYRRGVPVTSNCVKVEVPDWIAALRPSCRCTMLIRCWRGSPYSSQKSESVL